MTRLTLLLTLSMLLFGDSGLIAASGQEAVPTARPKTGKTVGPPLSENVPEEVRSLPLFGSIEWTTHQLPWVGEGPDAGISGMGMVAYEGKIYAYGGFIPGGDGSGDAVSHRTSRWTRVYDPALGTWEKVADAPVRREYARSVVAGDSMFLLGGACQYKKQEPPYKVHGDCFQMLLSGQSPAWKPLSSLNVPRTHTAVGFVDPYLIVAGGNEYDFAENGYSARTIRDTNEVFDLDHPEKGWQRKTPIPEPARGWSGSLVARDRLYVFGGITWKESEEPIGVRETLTYDPHEDRWDRMAAPPLPMSAWEGDLFADRYAILVGGVVRTPGVSTGSLVWSDLAWTYDTEDDQWLRVEGFLPPGAVFNDPGVAIVGDRVYVMGAEGPHGSHYNYFLEGRIQPAAAGRESSR